jgi:NTE family protein
MFEPIKIDGRDLIDGGLTEPVPVIAAREMGADFVIGVDVAFRPSEDGFQGLTGVAFQTMHIMANALIKEQLPRADFAIRMNVHALIGQTNSHASLMAAGHAAAMKAWPKLAAMLA